MNRNLKNDWKYDQIIITFTNWRLHELKVLRFCVCCLEVGLAYHCTRVQGLCQAAGVHLWSLCSPNQCRRQCLWCKDAKRLDVHPRSQEVGPECLGSLAALSGILQVGEPSRNSRSSTCELLALPCACTWSRNFLLDGTHQVFFFCHDQRTSPWIAAVRQCHPRQSCRSLGVIWIISHAAHGLDASTLSSALWFCCMDSIQSAISTPNLLSLVCRQPDNTKRCKETKAANAAVRILSQSVFKSFSVKTSALRNAQQAVPSGKCLSSVSSIAANQGLTLDGKKSKRYPSLAGPGQAEIDAQQ